MSYQPFFIRNLRKAIYYRRSLKGFNLNRFNQVECN